MKRNANNNSTLYLVTIGVVVGLLLIVVIMRAPDLMNRNNASEASPQTEVPVQPATSQNTSSTPDPDPSPPSNPATPLAVETSKTPPTKPNPFTAAVDGLLNVPTIKLQDVVSSAQTWMPVESHKAWFGGAAPAFSVVDIDGQRHSLADFKGKQVVIALWASSFAPSVNGLKTYSELRDAMPSEELVVLGVSFDDPEQVKRTMKRQPGINYPIVAAATQNMPAPYSKNRPVPGAIFIDADGTLKISVHGTIPLEEIKQLLQAG